MATVLLQLGFLQGCAVVDIIAGPPPTSRHQAFLDMRSRYVGKTIGFTESNGLREQRISSTRLAGGYVENAYDAALAKRSKPCTVYYAYEEESKIILRWRYEGDDESCIWLP